MSANFGYAPDRAERVHDQLDRHVSAIEYRFGRLRQVVPDAATPVSRLDLLLEEVREVATDLHAIVERRTDREVA